MTREELMKELKERLVGDSHPNPWLVKSREDLFGVTKTMTPEEVREMDAEITRLGIVISPWGELHVHFSGPVKKSEPTDL